MGTLTSVFYSSKTSNYRKGRGEVKPPQSINIGVFNVRGCCTDEVKESEIGKMILRWRLDVCALRGEGRVEVTFGEVVGRVAGWRALEGVALLLSERLLRCVVEWKEVSSRLVWVIVKIERESWVFISAYGLDSERSEQEIEVLE